MQTVSENRPSGGGRVVSGLLLLALLAVCGVAGASRGGAQTVSVPVERHTLGEEWTEQTRARSTAERLARDRQEESSMLDSVLESDDADQAIAFFRETGDVGNEARSGVVVANNKNFLEADFMAEDAATEEFDESANESKREKADWGGVDGDGADRKKVGGEEEIDGDDSHEADDTGDGETPKFGEARTIKNDLARIKSKSEKNENPERKENDDGEEKFFEIDSEIIWARVEIDAR